MTHIIRAVRSSLKRRGRRQAVLLAAVLAFVPALALGQAAATIESQETPSLTQALERARTGTQLNIFYVHGIGIDPPKQYAGTQDFEVSQEFRTGVCKRIHCTSEFVGRKYAGKDLFRLNARPQLTYLGQDLWQTNEDWNAAAPFVDDYDLVVADGTRIRLHEVNWWPLVMSAKCRGIIRTDSALVDPDRKHTAICSAKTVEDANGRYKSYCWLCKTQIETRKPGWPKAAAINRWAKHDLLDWGFTDALLAVGPLRPYLVEGIREIILDSYHPSDNQEFIIVSHSLGSYLMFSALDLRNDAKATTSGAESSQPPSASEPQTGLAFAGSEGWQAKFDDVLKKTSHAYFMANQLSLLELANLSDAGQGDANAYLALWGKLRSEAHQSATVVAFSDPDDLLTWQVPGDQLAPKGSVVVKNVPATNACRWCWLWLFANPESAHIKYDQNNAVLNAMFPKRSLRTNQ
jgi:hypothetical protein